MKILGIGVDIVQNKRINLLIKKKKLFLKRTFTKNELKLSHKIKDKTNAYPFCILYKNLFI